MSRLLCVGAGHVGLPLSLKLWETGHEVGVIDIDDSKIASLGAGRMPFREPGCAPLLRRAARDPRFKALTYEDADLDSRIRGAEYVIFTLGTPLGTDYTFRFDQHLHVLERLGPLLSRGVSIIVRSTVAPLFTRNVVSARLASARDWVPGVDFHPSFCPERLMQGRALADIDELPEIIGADDPETAARAEELFRSLGRHKTCIRVSTVEAELAKLFLNTFRYTLFGLANEFALCAEEYDANIFAILDAANAAYPRGGIPRPGPSRGPCLGKDTAALAFSTTSGLIAHAALKTNENVVLHVASELRKALGTFAHRRIAVLGLAFKPDTDDTRDNLTTPLINLLDREGAATAVYDPLVPGHDDPRRLDGSDAVVLMTPHAELRAWSETNLIGHCRRDRSEVFVFDCWNTWPWADQIFGKASDAQHEDSGYRRVGLVDARGDPSPA